MGAPLGDVRPRRSRAGHGEGPAPLPVPRYRLGAGRRQGPPERCGGEEGGCSCLGLRCCLRLSLTLSPTRVCGWVQGSGEPGPLVRPTGRCPGRRADAVGRVAGRLAPCWSRRCLHRRTTGAGQQLSVECFQNQICAWPCRGCEAGLRLTSARLAGWQGARRGAAEVPTCSAPVSPDRVAAAKHVLFPVLREWLAPHLAGCAAAAARTRNRDCVCAALGAGETARDVADTAELTCTVIFEYAMSVQSCFVGRSPR